MNSISKKSYDQLTKSINDYDFSLYQMTIYNSKDGLTYWLRTNFIGFCLHKIHSIDLNIIYRIKLWYWLKDARKIQLWANNKDVQAVLNKMKGGNND